MRNDGLDEAQAGIKIARRNVSNLRYAEDTSLMEESEKRTKEPLDESEIEGATVETVTNFILSGSKITAEGDCTHEIIRCLLLGRKP